MELNQAQREAVEYLGGPLLVLAGPGTGKTQLLSEKVAYILENTDTNPENILCLTFTESGASNMRERLRGMIKSDALKVNIGTYHAFGREILAQYQGYAENYRRVLDAAIDEVTQYKIVRGLIEELPAYDILRGDSVKNVISTISDAKGAGLSAADLARIAEVNTEDAEVLSEALRPLLAEIVPRKYQESHDRAYAPMYAVLQRTLTTEPILGRIQRSVVEMAKDLGEALEEAEAEQKLKPLSAWKDKYFEKDAEGRYRLKDRIANLKLASVARVMTAYEAYLREHGLYDFDDMIQEAARVLREDEGFKLTLEEKYQFIMLDEFQDTNPSQFEIVKALTEYEQPQIMAVGDDDQAIYEFQGAMSSNLTDFQKHYDAKVITLTENYRSTQEILDFAREIIRQADDRFADKELVAHRGEVAKAVISAREDDRGADVENEGDSDRGDAEQNGRFDNRDGTGVESLIRRIEFQGSEAEYAFIAEEIARLIQAGVPQSEIAVISYKTKYFEPLLPFLKAKPEIRIAYERKDDLLEDPKIHQILTILGYANALGHEQKPTEQLMEILTYPVWGLEPIEVVKKSAEARAAHRGLFEVMADGPRFAGVAEWLANLAAMTVNEPLEVALHEVVAKIDEGIGEGSGVAKSGNSEIIDAEGAETGKRLGEGEYERYMFYENVASLLGRTKRHFGEKKLKVADLLEMVADYEEAEMKLTGASPYRDADEAVQILTAHKAKGLEFRYVFIVTADHTAWGKGKGNNNTLTLPKNVAQIRHTGMTDSERLRVLYVALTRAKEGLYITNARQDFNGKSPERLEYLNEYEEGERVVSPYLPTREVELRYAAGSPEQRAQNAENWLAVYRPNSPEMREIYLENVRNWRMSASALTSFIDVTYAGPKEFFKNYVLRAPQEPESEALAFGDLIHKTFEVVTKNGLSDEQALGFYLEELEKKDLSSLALRKIRERGTEGLSKALGEFGSILRTGEAEVNLGPEKLVIGGVPVTGKIDHIVIDEEAKRLELYDFKTSNFHQEKWSAVPSLYKYAMQLGFYKLLLNHSAKYEKYEVARAHVLFVTPDRKDGKLHDKVYEFTSEAEAELTALMRAVYGMVEDLSFLDDPEVLIEADRKKGLRDMKQFVELLLAKGPEK